jgi:hypothetical protein
MEKEFLAEVVWFIPTGKDCTAFVVNAHSFLGANIAALAHMDKLKINENQIDQITLSYDR